MAKKASSARESEPSLKTLRDRLKQLDQELLAALVERADVSGKLQQRQKGDLSGDLVTKLQQRQTRIEKLAKKAGGELTPEQVRAVFAEVLAIEPLASSLRVAYLGPPHTFSHAAAVHQFGAAADLAPVGTIAAVFEEVDRGTCQLGVAPLENSTDGRVTDTLDCFARTEVRICGELPLRIHHCLHGSGPREGIRTVCSKPQALSQCRKWLAEHLPQAEAKPVSSTAESAKMALEDPTIGAIASEQAGRQLGLELLAKNIEDAKDNITRFAILGSEAADPTGRDKTALMFEVSHEPGALADAMGIFKRQMLNMTWIESFPIPGSGGRYLFFVELMGHATEGPVDKAIAQLRKKANRLVVLGSYPQTDPIG